jgi:Tfp pilus assembly protein PilF
MPVRIQSIFGHWRARFLLAFWGMRFAVVPLLVLTFCSSINGQPEPLSGGDMKHFAPDAVELGWKYFKEGDCETALKRFQMAIRHDPDFAPAYFGAAYVCSAEGKLDEAIKYYRETLRRDTLYVYTYANLGYALLQEGKFPEALQMLDKALEIDPTCGVAHLTYANYYAYKEDWKDAEQSVNKALKYGQKLDPELREMLEKHGVKIAEN